MIIIDKFLDLNLLKIVNHKKNVFSREKHLGFTNLSWDSYLQQNSSLVFIMPFFEINQKIKNTFIEYNQEYKKLEFDTYMYVWGKGSNIPVHNDGEYVSGATIYLNKRWGYKDGGIFLYENKIQNKIEAIIPKFNTCIINDKHESHLVTSVNYNSDEPRITLQIWMNKVKKNNLYVYD